MAAGLGFKTFVTGEVLTAADTNGYLMQGINVFATTAARDAAITAPAEGQFAFTKDTNGLWYYDGATWVASGATGDIEGVTAGIGISGGGTSGTVTVTNSMATAIDAKGDLVAGTGADAFSRLAVGANDTVLTADSAQATGLKWAAIASGGMTLLSTTTLSGASTTISSISQSYNSLYAVIAGVSIQTTTGIISCAFNGANNGNYTLITSRQSPTVAWNQAVAVGLSARQNAKISNATNNWVVQIDNYSSTTQYKPVQWWGNPFLDVANDYTPVIGYGTENSNTATSSIVFNVSAGTFSAGTVYLYGVK